MKFVKMISSAANYISSIVLPGSAVGIVSFSDNGNILSNLIIVNSDDDRDELLNALPKSAVGATCIGCGLREAITVILLKQNKHIPKSNSTPLNTWASEAGRRWRPGPPQ